MRIIFSVFTDDEFVCDEAIYVSTVEEAEFAESIMWMWANAVFNACNDIFGGVIQVFENDDWDDCYDIGRNAYE